MSDSPFLPVSAVDYEVTARFIEQTLAHIESLHHCQRHTAAADSAAGLRRLVRTVREAGKINGFSPDILFGDLFQRIEDEL